MIPHVICHPGRAELLQFVYDFDAKTTTIKPHRLEDGKLVAGPEKVMPKLLRYPTARAEHWYVAVMEVREFGEPAYVERWSWDELECADQYLIEHPKFGLTAMGIDDTGERAVVDRFFPTEEDDLLAAKVVSLPDMAVLGHMEINAGMGSPVFSPDRERVAMVLYDQGGCSANVYALSSGGAEKIAELAGRQIVTDFEQGCVAFLPDNELAVWSVQNWDFEGQFGVYDIGTGEARFVADAKSETTLATDDEEGFSFRLENTQLAMLVEETTALVGAVGGYASVDLGSGDVTHAAIEGAGAVVQLRRCGGRLIAVDNDNTLFVV